MNLSPRASARVPLAYPSPGAYFPVSTPCASGDQTICEIPFCPARRKDVALRVLGGAASTRAATRRSSRSRARARGRPPLGSASPFQFETPMYRALPARTTSVSAAERLLERDLAVVAVALVEVDVVGAQPRERGVDLLEDLRAREPAVAVGHLAVHLRREHVRVARSRLEARRRGTPPHGRPSRRSPCR